MSSAPLALITGGTKRVGWVVAQALAQQGFHLALHTHPRNTAQAEECTAVLRDQGFWAVPFFADLMDEHQTQALVPQVCMQMGPPTLLVNNAAIFLEDTPTTFSLDVFHAHMDVNLRAPLQLSAAFAKALPQDQKGLILHILDQRVLKPSPHYFSYTLSKSALLTATRTMAQAFAPHIRVNAIGPGPTFPNALEGEKGFVHEIAHLPLHMPVDPYEIARTILYFLEASSVTGQMIAVDSGQHLS